MSIVQKLHIVLCQRQIAGDGRGGGLGTLYANIATAMVAAGASVTLVTATEPDDVGIAQVDIVSIARPSPDPTVYADQVDAALGTLEFDLAECASWKAELAGYAARPSATRAPVVVRGELPGAVLDLPPATCALERTLMQHAEGVLAVSRTVAELIMEHYGRQVDDIVHNAVDARIFNPGASAPRPDGPRRVLWVGSHTPIKHLDHVETIVQRSATAGIVFDIVVPRQDGNARLQRLASYPHVTLHHHITQDGMAALYRRADVFLSTSRLEAFGLGILEAMACGTPVLVPRGIGGATEFVRASQDGYYYASIDDAIDRLVTADWARFGAEMVQHAQRFSWTRCVAQTLANYRHILEGVEHGLER